MTDTRSSMFVQLQGQETDAAWNSFCELYSPLISQTVRKCGIPPGDQEDVVQDVLLKLLRLLPNFTYSRRKGHFRGWLRQLTKNLAIDQQRRCRGRARSSTSIEEVPQPIDDDDWDREFEHQLMQLAIQQASREFRSSTWACFDLLFLNKLPAREVSLQLGISENAVYVNSSRVTSRIREICRMHGEEFRNEILHKATSLLRG